MATNYVLGGSYGKQSVPVFKVQKDGPRHSVVDMIVQIMLEGDVSASWLSGDNKQILPTETQKNTCYALALTTDFASPEDYGIALGRDILKRHGHLTSVNLSIESRQWERIEVDGAPHNHLFSSGREPVRHWCEVAVSSRGSHDASVSVKSGVRGMKLMKTTQSGFKGYIVDKYTNLKPVGEAGGPPDRIMATELEALWTFTARPSGGYGEAHARILNAFLRAWGGPADTGVYSLSLQQTAYNACTAVLDGFPEVGELRLVTPNIHFYTYPLEQFGLDNPNIVFQSTECASTASGRIVTHVARRGAGGDAGAGSGGARARL